MTAKLAHSNDEMFILPVLMEEKNSTVFSLKQLTFRQKSSSTQHVLPLSGEGMGAVICVCVLYQLWASEASSDWLLVGESPSRLDHHAPWWPEQ